MICKRINKSCKRLILETFPQNLLETYFIFNLRVGYHPENENVAYRDSCSFKHIKQGQSGVDNSTNTLMFSLVEWTILIDPKKMI